MAFRLKIDEPIAKSFRRAGVSEIERARRQLAAGSDPATAIHEARKCLKRIRALLRLGRKGLGEEVFRFENEAFRSIAQALAPARDAHVLLQTIAKLSAENGAQSAAALTRLKDGILASASSSSATEAIADGRAEADAALARAARRFRRLRLAPDSFATLEHGFVQNYTKGREWLDRAYADGEDESFHEWRKRVQALWRHLALLSRSWPALFAAHIEAARELSQILGDDHDLALLRTELSALPPGVLSRKEAQEIETLIADRQTGLRRTAHALGKRVFAERPKAIGRRISAIWEAAGEADRKDASDEDRPPEKSRRARAPAQ